MGPRWPWPQVPHIKARSLAQMAWENQQPISGGFGVAYAHTHFPARTNATPMSAPVRVSFVSHGGMAQLLGWPALHISWSSLHVCHADHHLSPDMVHSTSEPVMTVATVSFCSMWTGPFMQLISRCSQSIWHNLSDALLYPPLLLFLLSSERDIPE